MSDDQPKLIADFELSLIQPNPHQPRKQFDAEELRELKESIAQHGILEPIVLAHTPAGYQIVAGERRWRAAKQLGLKTVPAYVKKTTPRGMLEMSIVENIQRSDLNVLERAHALNRLAKDFQLSVTEIAKRIGKSAAYVSNSVRLLDLPDAIKDGLLSELITEGHARAIQSIADTKHMIEAYKQILRENATVRRAEDLARRFRELTGQQVVQHRPKILVSEQIDTWQKELQTALGESSDVKLRRSYRQTQLVITLKGSVTQTQKQLDRILQIARPNAAR